MGMSTIGNVDDGVPLHF
ncbi:hypothetical protein A2U01_0106624, partial [Trifolium medium]|nr:hypothetical protein [Trifolium medium]